MQRVYDMIKPLKKYVGEQPILYDILKLLDERMSADGDDEDIDRLFNALSSSTQDIRNTIINNKPDLTGYEKLLRDIYAGIEANPRERIIKEHTITETPVISTVYTEKVVQVPQKEVRIIEKPVYKEKIVTKVIEKPVERIVYREKRVEVPVTKTVYVDRETKQPIKTETRKPTKKYASSTCTCGGTYNGKVVNKRVIKHS